MKFRLSCLPLAAALICGGYANAGAQEIQVTVNGSPVHFFDTQPRMMEGRVLVPLRGVLEKMGARVGWDQASQIVTADRGHMALTLPIGSHTAQVNGREVRLDVPAMVVDGSTLVPLRFVSEALGADVGWSDATETVSIVTPEGDEHFRPNQPAEPERREPERHDADRDHWTIGAGTVIPLKLNDDLSSNGNNAGDQFSATIAGMPGSPFPAGAKVSGVVREAIPAHNGRPGILSLEVRSVEFPDGFAKEIDARLINLDSKFIHRGPDGRLIANERPNDETLKWVGIGAGSGLIVSTAAHGNEFLDTLAGGGAGALYAALREHGPHNVRLAAGTRFGARLMSDFTYSRHAAQ